MRRACVFGALALVLALAACGGGGGGGKAKAVVGPAIDEKTAQQDAQGLVDEIYDTLGRGNKDSLFTLLDDELIVFGPRGKDALATRADALVALGEVVDPRTDKKLALRSSSREVVASPGGRSAWAFDVVTVNGAAHAMLAILTNAEDIWLVKAVSVAHTPSRRTLEAENGKDAVVPPGASGPKHNDADDAVARFKRGLLEQEQWGDDLGSRSDAIYVGPAAGEVARGKKAIKKLWKKRVEQKTRAAISGDVTAATTADGQLAWVSAPITRVADEQPPTPLRAFAVFENADGGWKLIALQEAAAVDAAGSGASWKKTLPPAPEPPKEEAPAVESSDKKAEKKSAAKKSKKAKKKSKKKKKKKRAFSDD